MRAEAVGGRRWREWGTRACAALVGMALATGAHAAPHPVQLGAAGQAVVNLSVLLADGVVISLPAGATGLGLKRGDSDACPNAIDEARATVLLTLSTCPELSTLEPTDTLKLTWMDAKNPRDGLLQLRPVSARGYWVASPAALKPVGTPARSWLRTRQGWTPVLADTAASSPRLQDVPNSTAVADALAALGGGPMTLLRSGVPEDRIDVILVDAEVDGLEEHQVLRQDMQRLVLPEPLPSPLVVWFEGRGDDRVTLTVKADGVPLSEPCIRQLRGGLLVFKASDPGSCGALFHVRDRPLEIEVRSSARSPDDIRKELVARLEAEKGVATLEGALKKAGEDLKAAEADLAAKEKTAGEAKDIEAVKAAHTAWRAAAVKTAQAVAARDAVQVSLTAARQAVGKLRSFEDLVAAALEDSLIGTLIVGKVSAAAESPGRVALRASQMALPEIRIPVTAAKGSVAAVTGAGGTLCRAAVGDVGQIVFSRRACPDLAALRPTVGDGAPEQGRLFLEILDADGRLLSRQELVLERAQLRSDLHLIPDGRRSALRAPSGVAALLQRGDGRFYYRIGEGPWVPWAPQIVGQVMRFGAPPGGSSDTSDTAALRSVCKKLPASRTGAAQEELCEDVFDSAPKESDDADGGGGTTGTGEEPAASNSEDADGGLWLSAASNVANLPEAKRADGEDRMLMTYEATLEHDDFKGWLAGVNVEPLVLRQETDHATYEWRLPIREDLDHASWCKAPASPMPAYVVCVDMGLGQPDLVYQGLVDRLGRPGDWPALAVPANVASYVVVRHDAGRRVTIEATGEFGLSDRLDNEDHDSEVVDRPGAGVQLSLSGAPAAVGTSVDTHQWLAPRRFTPRTRGFGIKIQEAAETGKPAGAMLVEVPMYLRYFGALRMGVGVVLRPEAQHWSVDAVGGGSMLRASPSWISGEVIVGYSQFFERRGRSYLESDAPWRARFGLYAGLGVLSLEQASSAVTWVPSVHLGPELELGKNTSLVLAAAASRVQVPQSGRGDGDVVSGGDPDEYLHWSWRPALSVVVNFTPAFFRLAVRQQPSLRVERPADPPKPPDPLKPPDPTKPAPPPPTGGK